MAVINVTPGSVAPVTTGSAPTVSAWGMAGENLAPGKVVYADPSSNNLIRLASASDQRQAANVVGIALGSAAAFQPVNYAISGDVLLPATGSGSALISGSAYVLSTTPGGLVSTADNPAGTGTFTTFLGVGNGTVSAGTISTLRLNIIAAGALKVG